MSIDDRLLELIQRLYAAPGNTEGWQAFLLDLCTALDGTGASFISYNAAAHQGDVSLTARMDPAAVRSYRDDWAHADPWATRAGRTAWRREPWSWASN